MDLSSLVEFARRVTPDAAEVEGPGTPPPGVLDTPVVERDGRMPFLDLVARSPVPPWTLQPGPPADGVVIEEGVVVPPQPLPSAAIGKRPDVLAAYLPYHFYPNGRWGIYVLESGIAAVAAAIEPATWPPSQDTVDLAWNLLVDHERFHCLAESAVTRGETIVLDGLYRGYFHDRASTPYEEAMANAYAFRMFKKAKKGSLADVKNLLLSGGHGYDQFEAFVPGHAFGRGEALLARRALDHDQRLSLAARPTGSFRYLFQPVRLRQIPVRPVPDQGGWLRAVRKFPSWGGVQADAHVEDHPPVHFHVRIPPSSPQFRLTWPDLGPTGNPLRALSTRERKSLAAYLERHGVGIRRRLAVAYGVDPGPPAT